MWPNMIPIWESTGVIGGTVKKWWELSGITNFVAVYQGIGAVSYEASKINLANPGTYDLTEGVAPSWTAGGGWVGAAGKYLRTGITADQSTYSMMFRFANLTGNGYLGGWNNTANKRFCILVRPVTNNDIDYRYVTDNIVGPALTTGTLAISGGKGYRNGVAEAFSVSPASATGEIYIIDAISGGLPSGSPMIGNLLVAVISSGSWTPAEVLALHNSMSALTEASTP